MLERREEESHAGLSSISSSAKRAGSGRLSSASQGSVAASSSRPYGPEATATVRAPMALPQENMPAGFNGAVGTFILNFSAGPTNVAVGDPITVRVQLSGRGAFDTLALPEQTAWQDFKTYPPTAKVDTTGDPMGIQGSKTFEQVIVPQKAEIKELPPISFSFFDPEGKTYRTLTEPATRLVVRPSGVAPAPTIASANRSQQQ